MLVLSWTMLTKYQLPRASRGMQIRMRLQLRIGSPKGRKMLRPLTISLWLNHVLGGLHIVLSSPGSLIIAQCYLKYDSVLPSEDSVFRSGL